ncbi:MAG: Unknown protein [uncultured Thiotrichaceae bacterium]|uniref:Uncharacterized protein n=1 Tax=uncultured Thiotrichaceae bacterium TaxID=298394 RepID=A0A6S6TL33_9GAMM|nr:MAG: Unknown protein [uncultured Thiotrichaceae bacterium]
MSKWLIIFSLAVLSACSSTKPVAQKSGMIELSPNIYVDPAMSSARRQQLLDDIKRAEGRIANFFGGEMQSTPTIHACVTKQCLQAFSDAHLEFEAKALGASTILLAEAGCNETIITHEMTHIELHQRLGKDINLNKIPMWFDEGLAVLACKDPRYTKGAGLHAHHGIQLLKTESQWLSAINNYKKPYQRSYQRVQEWHASAGTQGLLGVIDHMKRTGEFSLAPTDKSTLSKNIAQY